MGKASRWFRRLLGIKSSSTSQSPSASTPSSCSHPKPPKKKWSFIIYSQDQHHHHHSVAENALKAKATFVDRRLSRDTPSEATQPSGDPCADDLNGHAIAVATATAAVADSAVTAVVRLTSGSGRSTPMAFSGTVKPAVVSGSLGIQEWAAVKIQSHFRSYLARRALRALKALVRVQALVRGHIMRKQTADAVRTLQTVLRVQACAHARRVAQVADTSRSVTKSSYLGPVTPEKHECIREKSTKSDQSLMLKRNNSKTNGRVIHDQDKAQLGRKWLGCIKDEGFLEDGGTSMTPSLHDHEKTDKILEVDNRKTHITPKRKGHSQASNLSLGADQYSYSFTTSKDTVTHHRRVQSLSSGEVQFLRPLKFSQNDEENSFCAADNSPKFYSASSEGWSSGKGLLTPAKSYGSRSCLSGYVDYPSYMAYTESAKAKLRSVSAPKQRSHFERSSSTNKLSVHGYKDTRYSTQRISTLHGNFTSKAYPGSGRLDRLGMPLKSAVAGFSGGHWIRY